MTTKTAMDPVKLDALPTVLKDAPLWRIWKRSETGGKKPVDLNGSAPIGYSGHDLATAHPLATAAALLNGTYGLGITTGYAPIPMVVVDMDCDADFAGARVTTEQAGERLTHLVGLPWAIALKVHECYEVGGYAELSPSGNGAHLFLPGTVEGRPGTRFTVPLALAEEAVSTMVSRTASRKISAADHARESALQATLRGEVYVTNRWLTVTGNHLHPRGTDTAAITMTPNADAQAMIDTAISWCNKRNHTAAVESVQIDATLRAEYIAPENLTGKLRIFGSEKRAAIWSGQKTGDQSRIDYNTCLTLFELLGDDAAAVNAALISSGRVREKWFRMTAGQTWLALTISNARAEWVAGGMKDISGQTGSAAPVTVDWSQEARDHLLFKTLNSAKGALSQRHAARRLLLDLLDLLDAGEYHVHDGELHIHTGGLAAISERIGGSTTSISARLEWYAMSGVISSYSRDSEGRPRIVMAASSAQCIALQEGLRPGCDIMPCRPPSSKPRVTPAAPRVARDPLPRHLQRAEWTMWMIHSGARDVNSIAAMTGQTVRSTRKNLADMQELKLLTDDLTPTCSRPEFRALVVQERTRNNAITRARRVEATLEYRRRMEMRNLTYNSGGYDEVLSNAAD